MRHRTFEEWTKLTAAELQEATKEYDDPNYRPKNLKPTAKEKLALRRFMEGRREANKSGRPRVGEGAKRVLITVEGGLLRMADNCARREKMTRSEFIAHGLRLAMKKAGQGMCARGEIMDQTPPA